MRAKTFKTCTNKYTIQIRLPADLSSRILTWGDENIDDDLFYTNPNDLAFGREDDPHITVLYRLDDNDPRLVEKILADHKSFDVHLGKTSLFTSNDFFDVLKIDVAGDELFGLNCLLTNSLNPPIQYPRYVPHVTIGFMKKHTGCRFKNLDVFEGERFTVENLYFVCRAGVKTNIKMGPQ